jgi:hypothetical protein
MGESGIDAIALPIVTLTSNQLSIKNGEVWGGVQCLGSQLESWSVAGIIYSIDIVERVHDGSGATIVPPPKMTIGPGLKWHARCRGRIVDRWKMRS